MLGRSLCFLFLVLFVAFPVARIVEASANGGEACAGCTLVIQLLLNLMAIDEAAFDHVLMSYCTTLPEPYAAPCIIFAEQFGEQLVEMVGENASSDDMCRALGVCTSTECNLMPTRTGILPKSRRIEMPSHNERFLEENNVWAWLQHAISQWTAVHDPAFDLDGDKFGHSTRTMRGYNWRGKDCDVFSDKVYPGRSDSSFPDAIDQDCNGIYGRDHLARSYENMYCSGTERRGVISLGDSATAHFRIPPQYLTAADINATTYDHMIYWGLNEADWPHRSWGTGHLNDTTGDCAGPLDSIYLNVYHRNRCNFRDYQNIGVNGARTSSMKPPGIIESMARNPETDHKALVIFALVGNDVCSGHTDFSHMTTPEDFQTNVLESLEYLNSTLPAGSNVLMVGLAQGEVLWNAMYNRTHPIGCTYEALYDYLNCLQISPCWGWMNSNATVRALTSLRARELSAVYETIIANYSFANFEMAYTPFPLPEAIKIWTDMGGQVYELIEPVDGFHPSQIANGLLGQIISDMLIKDLPDFIGPVNPNNDLIQETFGDQGGY